MQLAAIVDEQGAKIATLDNNCYRLPIDAVRQTVKEDQWDVIGIGGLITQYKFIKELLPVCREENPDAVIVGGGGFVSSMPREMMHWLPDLDVGCFTPETEVVTNPSAIPIGEIEVGTKVLGIDGAYHKVSNTYTRPYRGLIYNIKPEGGIIAKVTGEHPFLAIRTKPCRYATRGRNQRPPCIEICSLYRKHDCSARYSHFPYIPQWIRADQLKVGDYLLYPIDRQIQNPKKIYLQQLIYLSRINDKAVKIKQLSNQGLSQRKIAMHLHISRKAVSKHLKRAFKKTLPYIKISPDLLLLAGYYVAEGCINAADTTVDFSFHKKETIYIADVLRICKKIFHVNAKIYKYKNSNGVKITACSKALAQFLGFFGKGAINKRIPHFAMHLPIALQKYLILGMYRGDGFIGNRWIQYSTISSTLSLQLKQLLLRQEIIPSLNKPRPKQQYIIGNKTGITQKKYSIHAFGKEAIKLAHLLGVNIPFRHRIHHHSFIKGNYAYIRIRNIATEFYDGVVCNLEVPETNSYALSTYISAHNCIGEGYITWREILDHVDDRNWKRVKGLVYREGKKIKLSKMRPLIPEEKLDEEIPFPAYEFSPVETYLMNSRIPYSPEAMHPNCRRLGVLTSYGCPYTCYFCMHPSMCSDVYGKLAGKPFRQHSPDYVVNLISHLRQQYCLNFISFLDETFCVNRKWFFEFCEKLEESGLATLIHWGIVTHTRTVDAELLQKGKDCGLSYISYGGESGSNRILKEIGKNQTKEQMSAAIQATQAAGINPIMSFIIGHPKATIEDLMEDLQFFIDNQIHVVPFFLTPYPATPLYKQYKDEIIEQYLTEKEKDFLKNPSKETYLQIFDDPKLPLPDMRSFNKQIPMIKEKVRNIALERWVLALDDATQLSVNLTDFNDVELAGLRYMISTTSPDLSSKVWDVERLKKFKELKGGIKNI